MNVTVITADGLAYSAGKKAAFIVSNSKSIVADSESDPMGIESVEDKAKAEYKYISWGKNDKKPNEIQAKIKQSETLSANIVFNAIMTYGGGVQLMKKQINEQTKKVEIVPCVGEYPEIESFINDNNIPLYLLEQCYDIHTYNHCYVELILDMQPSASRKIVEIHHKETMFSRVSPMDADGNITEHYYSAKWYKGKPAKEYVSRTPMLKSYNPSLDLQRRIGRVPDITGKAIDEQIYSYILPIYFPSIGARAYYPESPWYAIFASGWFDLAIAIPAFKKALLNNQMTLKYLIEIDKAYFDDVFKNENIVEPEKRKERIGKEYDMILSTLTGMENTGKAVFSTFTIDLKGTEHSRVKITVLENPMKGGDFIEDTNIANSMICYAQNVHPSLNGASPGSTKAVNGTEARELFNMKQVMMKPFRDLLLAPFNIIKKINKWPDEISFEIIDRQLTTLDTGKGTQQTANDQRM